MKKVPKYLHRVLDRVSHGEGDDIEFVLSYVGNSARSYMSKLKSIGLAYTHSFNGQTEVWLTKAGRRYLQENPFKEDG